MSDHKRQHWIPDTYLDAWCDPDPARQNPKRVYRFNPDGSFKDYRTPSRLFTKDDLYTVPGPNGERGLEAEHSMTRLEDAFARMRKGRLEKGLPLPPKDRVQLIWFISAMRNRSPAAHAHDAYFNSRVLEIGDDMKAAMARMSPDERAAWGKKAARMTLKGTDDVSIPLEAFREIVTAPFGAQLPNKIAVEASVLERMYLTILRAPDGHTFLTSDRPVTWWDPEDPPPTRSPLGLGRASMQVTVPLTPSLCAMISHVDYADYMDVNDTSVANINDRTVHYCREVYISQQPPEKSAQTP
jgi:hypothetical protein